MALNNKGTWITHFFQPCMQKNHIYASDYPVSEHMKFICAVNIYASGTVWIWSWSIAQYPPPCNPPCFPNSLQVIIYIPLINTYIDWEVTVVKFVRDPLYPSTHKKWLASNFSLQCHPESNINVTRIKEIITNKRSYWLLNKFSHPAPLEMNREQYGNYAYWC